jgi:hypothetical protein
MATEGLSCEPVVYVFRTNSGPEEGFGSLK